MKPDLPDVTLVAVTSVAVNATLNALSASMRQVRFGNVLFLTDLPRPDHIDREIEWRRIDLDELLP